jgi:hypothetical protein
MNLEINGACNKNFRNKKSAHNFELIIGRYYLRVRNVDNKNF